MNLQEHINASGSSKAYYEQEIGKLDAAQHDTLIDLLDRLTVAGAKHPMPWAYSEVNENKPQFARFLVLRNLIEKSADTAENISLAMDTDSDEDVEADYAELLTAVGEAKLTKFLKDYGQGLIWNLIDLLDEGNRDSQRDGTDWVLMETDSSGEPTGRLIQGLHENFMDFNE